MKNVNGIDDMKRDVGKAKGKATSDTGQMVLFETADPSEQVPNEPTLRYLWQMSAPKGKKLITSIASRKYFKRVYECSIGALQGDGSTVRKKIKYKRLETQQLLEDELFKSIRTAIQSQSRERQSLQEDKILDEYEEITKENYCFLIDLPMRGWLPGGMPPYFVSDYKRRHFSAPSESTAEPKGGKVWMEDMGMLMRGIAFFRVYCEPRLHRIITRVLTMKDMQNTIEDIIPELKVTK
jgi:hypothetical protein